MATGIKKTVEPHLLTHLMWAAWGVIDIETLGREPRRNYLKTVRAELETRGYKLECGGVAKRPYYRIFEADKTEDPNKPGKETIWTVTNATGGGFKEVCKAFLQHEDPAHAEPDGSAVAG